MLIIPSILIVHGVCSSQIAALAHETHHADGDIYSQNPVDRARLFRKENAKMLHLRFLDRDAWDAQSLQMIRELREAVDIPFGLSLPDRIPLYSDCETIFSAGVHRIFLPEGTPEELVLSYARHFGARKIIPTLDPSCNFGEMIPQLRSAGIDRAGIEISRRDALEGRSIDWERLSDIASVAASACIRITALHGIRGFPDLKKLESLAPAFDSLVLSRALNENRFPCQLIWREVEAEVAFETAPTANLWINPLAGVPHV